MSADNGIYIHKFPEGWKVTHFQGIDNVLYGEEEDKALEKVFRDSKVFKTEMEAFTEALRLLKEIGYVEYGIQEI